MRTSILSRSAIAVAALAVGAGALAAAPAQAAPGKPSEITRPQVLAAAAAVRADPATNPYNATAATRKTVRVLANRACSVNPDEEVASLAFGAATQGDQSADGVLVIAGIANVDPPEDDTSGLKRACVFGVLAARKSATTLTGTAKFKTSTAAPASYKLSRDVFVTPTRNFTAAQAMSGEFTTDDFSLRAAGATKTSVTVKVADKKTKSEKKAAKKSYQKRLKAAKKSYKKALAKAGNSTSKKKAAKKAYAAKKSAAKKKYSYAIAPYKFAKSTVSDPFNVTAKFVIPAQS